VSAGGGIQAHMHIIPNAVPCAPDSTSATRSDFFVYAGRLSREKGLNTLFKAVELAGVRLIVAGDGPLRQTLAAAKPAGVTMVGRVGGDEVDALLRDCRAAVVPSEWAENAPMAVLEPMALGRPVIATRMGGIPEQIRDGLDGILTTSGDVLELAAAMGLLAQDPALAARLGRSARDRVASRFSPARHTASLMRVYSSIVAGGADSTALL